MKSLATIQAFRTTLSSLSQSRTDTVVADYLSVLGVFVELEGVLARDFALRKGRYRHRYFGLAQIQQDFAVEWRSAFGHDCTNFTKLVVAYHRVFVEPGKVTPELLPEVVKALVDFTYVRNWLAHGRSTALRLPLGTRQDGYTADSMLDTIQQYWNEFYQANGRLPFLNGSEDDLVLEVTSNLF